ncbi:Monosaccharide-transporting ATPase [Pedosphaera parvula Ellin514]|uniref:Monosaccharide-transporting ATPase n=2 Tax=Pedosphaera TaxID=1032526 RepID=B9XBB5_PEDPL|nr:Monosaccharide-transporting ATPase [Pedosphaera parvula Ellin514]
MYEGFFSGRVVGNLFGDNASLGIAAVGMTLVILSGGIDLSVGSVLAFSTVFIATLVQQKGVNPMIAIGLALMVGTALGAFMGFLINRYDLPPFLVTLGGMFLARGMGFVISKESLGIENPLYNKLTDFLVPLGGKASLSVPALIFLAIFLVGILVTHYTPYGRNVYALGGSEPSARLMGVPIGTTKVAVYAISGFCSALAGAVMTIFTGSGNPTLGVGFELDVIASVVIGGTLLTGGVGSQLGTLAGVLIFGTINTALTFDGRLNSYWLRIAIGGLLLAFILFQRFLTRTSALAR